MGVEYFPCAHCKEVICDAGDFYTCEGCGETYCEECEEEVKVVLDHRDPSDSDSEASEVVECILCTSDRTRRKISKSELIQFLLKTSPYQTSTEAEAALRAQAD